MVTTIDPFPGSYAWWDGFGATAGRKNPHTGIDYPVRGGLPTPALVAGVVTDVRTTPWNGWCVTWQAADGVYVSYLHLSGFAVNAGDKVELGQTVGYVGNIKSKKFHLSTCSSVQDIQQSNRITFATRAAAVKQGYSPCRACRP